MSLIGRKIARICLGSTDLQEIVSASAVAHDKAESCGAQVRRLNKTAADAVRE